MSILFNLIYLSVMAIFSPWLMWRMIVQNKNRRGWSAKFLGYAPRRTSDAKCLWFHAVSVGEVNLLKPIIERIRQEHPYFEIAVSSTTETGRQLAADVFSEDITFFCPADFSWAIKRTLRRLRPDQLILAELELWPNLIRITSARSIPVSVINGRLSARSARGYRKLGFLFRPIFQQIDWIGAQSSDYAQRFVDNGCAADKVTITGSVKFDGVKTDRNNAATLELKAVAAAHGIAAEDFVFVGGSTQLEEDLLLADAYVRLRQTHPQLRLILVPRHPVRVPQLCREFENRKIPFALRSSEQATSEDASEDASEAISVEGAVLIVDVIGELSAWWGVADAGFVGGSMGTRGGQSMIEPAGFGVPVCFGPNTENFKSTVSPLIENDAAEVVNNGHQIETFIKWSIEMSHLAQAMGLRAQKVVAQNTGAADRTVAGILALSQGGEAESPPQSRPSVVSAA